MKYSISGTGECTWVDGHVHHYSCFDPATFLNAAWRNMAALGHPPNAFGALVLADPGIDDPLRSFRMASEKDLGCDFLEFWNVQETCEYESVRVSRSGGGGFVLVAGRQIVTREGLELLALGTTERILPTTLDGSIRHVLDVGAIPIVPWGFGKWWFRRGRELRSFLAATQLPFLLGDIGGRPRSFRRPELLEFAESLGRAVLAGSDPLPLKSQMSRGASYGSLMEGSIDLEAPSTWLLAGLRGLKRSPATFGTCRSWIGFVRDQSQLRLSKRRQT